MAKKIYKYELGVDGGVVTIKNCFSRIIKVMVQNGWPYIWMEIDEENYDESEINITAIGTGWDYDDDNAGVYVDSVIDRSGYVWHYFVDNPMFLSKQEKKQMEQYLSYQKAINNLFTGGYVENSSSGILVKEPNIIL